MKSIFLLILWVASLGVVLADQRAEGWRKIERNCARLASIEFGEIDVRKEEPQEVLDLINLNWLEVDPHLKGFDFQLRHSEQFAGKRLTITGRGFKVFYLAAEIARQLDAKIVIGPDAIEFVALNGGRRR